MYIINQVLSDLDFDQLSCVCQGIHIEDMCSSKTRRLWISIVVQLLQEDGKPLNLKEVLVSALKQLGIRYKSGIPAPGYLQYELSAYVDLLEGK